MKLIVYPNKEVIQTYLQIGCEIQLIISQTGSQAILCIDQTQEQLEHYLTEHLYLPINNAYDYKLFLNKDFALWAYHCPKYYKSISSRTEQHQTYYRDGMAIITSTLAELQCLTDIRLKKTGDEDSVSIFKYLEE